MQISRILLFVQATALRTQNGKVKKLPLEVVSLLQKFVK